MLNIVAKKENGTTYACSLQRLYLGWACNLIGDNLGRTSTSHWISSIGRNPPAEPWAATGRGIKEMIVVLSVWRGFVMVVFSLCSTRGSVFRADGYRNYPEV
ncbi:ubiquitin-protein ligase 7 [Striga asiatica]|uniref:Ubiquitin-protein ligase 7 n=1 Tax=Striga asiatica TaxID=4170 RepID=A0A5A7NZR0_STRAF|nr:ubiquitin-protein ligase 7 [Striga asiatica]